MINTILNENLLNSERMDAEPCVSYLTNKYNFVTETVMLDDNTMPYSPGINGTGVYLSTNYDNSEDFESGFYLDPIDALRLGEMLIRRAKESITCNETYNHLDSYMTALFHDINNGYVETLVVKLHRLKSKMHQNNEFVHIYNIYPKYIKSMKNNHFNFNIPMDISSWSGNKSPLDCITDIFLLDRYVYDVDEIFTEEEKESYYHFLEKYPYLLKTTVRHKIKVKFVNCSKVFKEDKEKANKLRQEIADKQRKKGLDDTEERILHRENMDAIRRLINTTPKASDGSIDFNAVMSNYTPK